MRRSTFPRRLATLGAAALLLSGLAGAASPLGVLAADRPVAHPIPLGRVARPATSSAPASRGRIDLARLVARPGAAAPGNLTVTGQTAAGYITVTDSSKALPSTSTINFPLGDSRANGINAPVDDTGQLWFVDRSAPSASVQLVLDLTGYFAAPPP